MKKYITILASALALVACSKDITPERSVEEPKAPVYGKLEVNVVPENSLTRAVTAYTAAQTYESKVNKVQILIFDSADKLYKYDKITSTSSSYEVVEGTYTVYALVNGPDLTTAQQATVSAFKAASIALNSNSVTATTGFVMSGSASATVGASGATASITVKRYASRVALQKITNNCPAALGDITVKAVWLANVVANQTVAGEDSPATWDNPYSRTAASGTDYKQANIVTMTGKTADDASLTFKAIGKTVASGASYAPTVPDLVYGYANSTSSVFTFDKDHIPTAWTPTKTRIVVEAVVNGETYWYPYDLTQFTNRNKASTIEMIISGPGLTDPQDDPDKLKKQDLDVSITVADWEGGESIELDY